VIVLTVVAVAPVLAVIATRTGRTYLPVQDFALIDLRVHDVWTSEIPLVGAYSRFGWNHPGPFMFWAVAPLSALAGGAPWATLVGGALLQGLGIVWLAVVAWRGGGLGLASGALAALVLAYSATGTWILLEPWNPHVAFPFFAVFLVQLWLIAQGDAGRIIGATVSGSILVQTHIGYAPLVVAGAVIVASMVLHDHHRQRLIQGQWSRSVRWSGVALGILWAPALLETALEFPGNFARIAQYTFKGHGGAVGIATATRIMATEWRPLLPWLGGRDEPDVFSFAAKPSSVAWLLVPAALVGIAAVVALRRQRLDLLRAVFIVAALMIVGTISIALIRDKPENYLFYWRIVLASFLVLAAGRVLVEALDASAVRRAAAVGVGALVVIVTWSSASLTERVVSHQRDIIPMEGAAREALQQVDHRGLPEQPFIVDHAGNSLGGFEGGLINGLEAQGAPVRVDQDRWIQFGHHRTAQRRDVHDVWLTTESGAIGSYLAGRPGARVVARTTPLPRSQERELEKLQQRAGRALVAQGRSQDIELLDSPLLEFSFEDGIPGMSDRDLSRMATLVDQAKRRGPCRCSIVVFDRDDARSLGL
jgi:hypothetical protein